ncbi:MAG TPA: neutral zinc metallopeptidase [Vicinamibacteria bacterium]|nr:neutral zinc metallopeptidase [Vicinamibacteria bacterium]
MRWEGREESDNVEDRRGFSIPGGGAGIGCGGLLLVIVISLVTGVSPVKLLALLGAAQQVAPQQTESRVPQGRPPADDPQARFVRVILKDTEDVWTQVFQKSGRSYVKPHLVLFEGRVDSACGMASAAVGPFYCPEDSRVYLDLGFFRELSQRFRAPGDFARAYVIAHEVGHHVQNLLGISDQVSRAQHAAGSKAQANQYSVRLELQADCYAGVFGHYDAQYLDPGEAEEGLRAAAAIGDDTLQKQSQGYVAPESFTHGSSAMRVRWLRRGLDAGDPRSCDTFQAPQL